MPFSLTAQDLLTRAFRNYASDPIATFRGETWTYREAWERAGRLASALADAGFERGDFVGVLMSNQLEYLTANLACVRGGYVNVPLNDMLTADEFRYMLSDSSAKGVVVGDGFTDTLADIRPDLPDLEFAVVIGDDPPEDMMSLSSMLDRGDPEGPDVTVDPDDLLRLSYTGGTTGKPKGVRQTHGILAANMLAHVTDLNIRHHEEMLIMTPLPHAAGYMHMGGMLKGAHFTITQGFDPGDFLDLVENGNVTWTFLVPTMIYRTLDHERFEETDVSGIETIVYGAAPITPERLGEALDGFGQTFIQLYGQTEMPDVGTILPKKDHQKGSEKITSCGKPATMVDVRIADPDDTSDTDPLPAGDVGEVLLRSPYTMDGYYNRPEQTAETLVDGWLRTGDIGQKDEDGYVYLLDRENDVIISGGMNVYTTEVEDALDGHEGIAQVAVIGVPHEDWGEAVHAVIVPRMDADISAEEVRVYADERLSDYKKPKSVEFVEELPTTPYGKVDKKALREPHWEDSDRQIN